MSKQLEVLEKKAGVLKPLSKKEYKHSRPKKPKKSSYKKKIKPKLTCANWYCENLLTEYELERQNRKFGSGIMCNKYRFCKNCRRLSSRIIHLRCERCGCKIFDTSGRLQLRFCSKCTKHKQKIRGKIHSMQRQLRKYG